MTPLGRGWAKGQPTICFAHVAYRLRERFLTLATGIESFEVRDGAALEQRIGEADVLVISGLWRNDLLPRAKRLRFFQSIGAGTDQFSRESLSTACGSLAPAASMPARSPRRHGTDAALARRLPEAHDNQAKRVWRGLIGGITQREDELGGKTLLIVGLGQIGGRLARLAKAFNMRVIGIRRDPRIGAGHTDAVTRYPSSRHCCRRPISLPQGAPRGRSTKMRWVIRAARQRVPHRRGRDRRP